MKKGKIKYKALDINHLLDETVELFRNTFNMDNIVLQWDKQPDLPRVIGDSIRLQQVVMNLITNAVDAMQDGDRMTLTIQSSLQPPDVVTIGICDSGPGFDEKLKDKLFDPFFTTRNAGLGIGLRICRSIIEEHGGQIWADNNPEGGGSFFFTLKAYREDKK